MAFLFFSQRRAKPKPAPRPRFTNNPNQRWSPTPGQGGFQGGVGHAQGGGPGGYNYNQQQPSNQHRGGGIPPNQQNSGTPLLNASQNFTDKIMAEMRSLRKTMHGKEVSHDRAKPLLG